MAYPKLTPIVAAGATEPRYLGDRFAEVVNAKDYGAKGDGVTDDTDALNAAMTAATGRHLHLPTGTYLTSTGLRIPSDTVVSGDGWSATTVKLTADDFAIPCVTNAANVVGEEDSNTGNWRIVLRDLCVDGNGWRTNGTGSPGDSGSAISFKNAHNVLIQNVRAQYGRLHCLDISSRQYTSIFDPSNNKDWRIGASSDVRVENFIGYDACADDVVTTHYSSRIQLINCHVSSQSSSTRPSSLNSNQCGIEIDDGSHDVEVRGCYATGFNRGIVAKGHDVGTTSEAAIPAKEVYFYDCCAESNNINFQVAYHGLQNGRDPGKIGFYNCRSLQPKAVVTASVDNPTAYFWFYGRAKNLVIDGLTCIGDGVTSSNYGIQINPLASAHRLESMYISNVSFESVIVDDSEEDAGYDSYGSALLRITGNNDSVVYVKHIHARTCNDVPVVYNTGTDIGYIEDINAVRSSSSSTPTSCVVYIPGSRTAGTCGRISDIVQSNYAGVLKYGSAVLSSLSDIYSLAASGTGQVMLFDSDDAIRHQDVKLVRSDSKLATGAGVGIGLGRIDSVGDVVDAMIHTQAEYSAGSGNLVFSVRASGVSALTNAWLIQAREVTTGDKFCLRPCTTETYTLGRSGYRVADVWSVNASNNTSDERLKTAIDVFPADVLDAWGDVGWMQYKLKSAVARKGETARLHAGAIAQQIEQAFAARGLDAAAYGFFCHDVVEEKIDAEGNVETEAVDEYSLRYVEALCVEAAYLRREIAALKSQIEELQETIASSQNN